MIPVHTILFPTDLSELAAPAFALACSLARDMGARLLVLHVVPPPVVHGEVVARRQPNGFYKDLWEELRKLQAKQGDVNVEHHLIDGVPATEIVRFAGEHEAGLIVMGTHGRTGLVHLLMGSVAEQVMRNAACPVLTVRCPAGKK